MAETRPDIVMYSTGFCPYCVAAKNFFKARGLEWREVRVDTDPSEAARKIIKGHPAIKQAKFVQL